MVNNYIAQSNSHAATVYLNKLFENGQYPEDADELFGYACLVQELLVQLGKESAQAVGSMDIMSSMTITIDQQSANNMLVSLLFLAANKGHRGAYQLLQLKVGMQSGGGVNLHHRMLVIPVRWLVGKRVRSAMVVVGLQARKLRRTETVGPIGAANAIGKWELRIAMIVAPHVLVVERFHLSIEKFSQEYIEIFA